MPHFKTRTNKDGYALVLAWPDTWCKQTGSWYDPFMQAIGWNMNGYYRVGHVAILLISPTGQCHYADFGRYHAPSGHGRVRTAWSDHELTITSMVSFKTATSFHSSLHRVLEEVATKDACHGDGDLFANLIPISFQKAWNQVQALQSLPFHPYGPFVRKGTNCARFVSSVIRGGLPSLVIRWKLAFWQLLSPLPTELAKLNSRKYRYYIQRSERHAQPEIQLLPSFGH